MPSSSAAARRLAIALLGLGAAPAFAQGDSGVITVRPARVPVPGSPAAYERTLNLPQPPPGPIESRLIVPEPASAQASAQPPAAADLRQAAPDSRPASTASAAPASPSGPVWSTAPVVAWAPPATSAAPAPAAAAPSSPSAEGPVGVIPFAIQSANLTDATRAELDQIAKRIAERRLQRLEVRGFATGDEFVSRKIALARALIVRSYLIDRGVKARIEVGSFNGDGEHVEILVPNT